MSDALTEVDFNIAEASKLPKGHFFKAAYELPNKQGTVRFTSKGRSMTAPTTLWVKGPKDKEYEEYKEYKNMRAAKKEYDGMKSAAQQEELDLFEDGEEGENKVTLKRKNKKGEIKVVPVERGERKAGEDEEDYEDRNPGGEKGWRSRKHLRHQKKDKEDQDKDPVGKQHEAAEWDVDDKKEKGEHADKTEAEIKKEIEKLKGKKGNEEEMASLKLALRAKGGWEKGEGATEEVEIDETLPDHLAKFLDKKGNPNKEAQARIDAGRKKRAAAAAEPKITDVTPKGYGPKEEVEVDEAKFKHPDAGVPLSVRRARKKKSAAQMKKDMNHADMLSKTNTGKAPVDYHRESEETIKEVSPPGWEGTIKAMKKDKDITNPWALGWWMKNRGYKSHKEEVEIDELSTDLLGRYKKRAAAQSSAASKAGYHKLAHKRYKGVNTATTLQFRNDAKKYDERQKRKSNEEVEIGESDDDLAKAMKAREKFAFAKKQQKARAEHQRTMDRLGNRTSRKEKSSGIGRADANLSQKEGVEEEVKFKVKLIGLPVFYVDGKSVGEIKQSLRRKLKKPNDDIESIERVTTTAVKKDFRSRVSGSKDKDMDGQVDEIHSPKKDQSYYDDNEKFKKKNPKKVTVLKPSLKGMPKKLKDIVRARKEV